MTNAPGYHAQFEGHQALENPQQATVRDLEDAGWFFFRGPALEKEELVCIEQLATAGLNESSLVPL